MKRMTTRIVALLVLTMCWATVAVAADLPDFTSIVEKNAPAVVHVEAKYQGSNAPSVRMHGNLPPDQQMPDQMPDIMRRFFGMPMMPPEDLAHTSLGSGFIISSDGYILTNDHVVDDADKVTVRLQDRRTLTAKVIGTDSAYDIALLKVNAGNLPTVTLGDSKSLKPGQWVLAIGSPFGFDHTVTQGIVSAVGRNLGSQDQPYTSFIQTDVPINRGNSGGPLFDLHGQVVGINSQIYSNNGGYMGVAFSIPIDVAMNAVQQIKTKGYVSRGKIGVQIQDVDADNARAMGLKRASGALVAVVEDGSPGQKAGIQVGDVIVDYNGTRIETASDLPPLVAATKPGSQATVTVLRSGQRKSLDVTLGELPRDNSNATAMSGKPATSGSGALGFSVQNLTADQRQALDLKKGEGVVIDSIGARNAAEAGLQSGYVILMVGQHKVGSVAQFKAATKAVKPGDTVMLLVRSNQGNTAFVTVTAPKGDHE